ncbi:hypothetical protein V8E54_015228 [Elaphomyces granulatus]
MALQELRKRKTKILLVMANQQLETLDKELQALQQALKRSKFESSFEVFTARSCAPSDLLHAIGDHNPIILHVCGHGDPNGLTFDGAEATNVALLDRLFSFATLHGAIGVILNACYSKNQADAIVEVVEQVIAMDGPLSDDSAIDFTTAFYGALGEGESFPSAFEAAVALLGVADDTLHPRLLKSEGN